MLFLIEYVRPEGRLATFERYSDCDLFRAEEARLALEVRLNRKGLQHEVVLLQAANEEQVRHTHGRYFENVRDLVRSAMGGDH